MGMIINIDKTKVMIIKSKKVSYVNFVYDDINFEEVSSYKYLGIDIHHKLNWNYSIEKRINGGWKLILVLKTIVNQQTLSCGIKISSFLKLLSPPLSCTVVKCGVATFLENLGGRLSKFRNVL